jgi:hypothetical protein
VNQKQQRSQARCGRVVVGVSALLLSAGLAWTADAPCKTKGTNGANCKKSHVITNDDLSGTAMRPKPSGANVPASLKPVSENGVARNSSGSSNGTVTVDGLISGGSISDASALLETLKHDEQTMIKRYEQIEGKLSTEQNEQMRKLYTDSLSRREETLANKRDQIRQVETAIHAAENGR